MEFQSAGHKISYAFLVKPKVAVLSDVTWVFFDVDLAKMNRKLQHSISFKGQLISKALFGVTAYKVPLFFGSDLFLDDIKSPFEIN